jgi:5-methylcytosine-specific restriction endonuclease McrA
MFVSLEELAAERRALDAREAAWLKKVAAYDRSDDWRADGYLNSAAALRNACRMDHGVARGHVDLARKLEALPEVAAAYGRGEISRRHTDVVANAYTPERAEAISEVEAELVDVARQHTPKELGGVVRYLTDAIDGDGGAASDEALYERRRYHLSGTLDGMLATNGLYDPEARAIHLAAINAEMERDRMEHDLRTPAQRRADAHTNLMRQSLDRGDAGTSRNVRPHVTVVVDLDEVAGTTPELITRVRTEGRRNGHLSAVTLERLTCDCNISRVITTGRSEVLDVGRATRTIPPAIWKALVVRDRHCQTPGCDQPPDRCHAHHIVHWTRGGPTNLQNLQLLCWHHHRHRHNHDAQARAA